MEEHPIAIDVRNLTKRYGSSPAGPFSLQDVTFQIPLGKICCLLGPNGSGKTTLLKILAGLLEPTSGEISIMGTDLHQNPQAVKSNIGWMPAEERSGFYGRLTGRQNLQFFATLQGVDQKELERILGNLAFQIGVQDELDKMLLKISSGAKQKIGVVRALLHNPAVVIMDEPVRNLDPHTILRFRRLIKDHLTRIQKKTVLLSTHLLEEAKRVADMIIIIKEGRVLRIIQGLEMEKEFRANSIEEFYLKTVDAGAKS